MQQKQILNFSVLDMLTFIAPVIPALLYWQDIDGRVLGLNEVCLTEMGAKNFNEIIGKTPYDFYPKETAEYILKHNKQVIESGEVSSQEENIYDALSGTYKTFLSVKAPLYDMVENIVGIVGVSLNITAKQEQERLKPQNMALLEEQVETYEMLKQCLSGMQNILQTTQRKISVGKNSKAHIKSPSKQEIKLTKREKEILYYLALNKSPREIAIILGDKDNKRLSNLTVSGIIGKQLYPKFGVFSVGSLVEKAIMLNLIPFVLEN